MTMPLILVFVTLSILALTLLYHGRTYWAWVLPGSIGLIVWTVTQSLTKTATELHIGTSFSFVVGIFVIATVVFGLKPLRRILISMWALRAIKPILPHIGQTERIALDAGTVWWERDLFSGKPDWKKLLAFTPRTLSSKEQAFLDGPVEELCSMVNEWEVIRHGDLTPKTWKFMKRHRFFGMIIPEEYGGLGFSAAAHSAIVVKVASRSVTAGVTIMVPNSLGPAELLLHYGTKEQKRHYLPRLASGEELPCFALTGPEAGSDAAATQSTGIVCRGTYAGQEVLGMRLNWQKRYITLGPIATVIGLAFRLRDPDGLLGGKEDRGITCALIPSDLPGIEIGARHDPMGVPFQNGPNWGRDVFVPLNFIIGGEPMAGEGWRMLMESLAAGRSISLPALSVALAQLATRVVGAYATIREQFDTPIGRFEGIEEPLARIGSLTYIMDAARKLTAGAVDDGERPVVASAIVKAYLTEAMRKVINDAMDIRAGAAICLGPRNVLAHAYQAVPVGITVEGANILTRSMIIYGQGAIRCHPYVQAEMQAAAENDTAKFDLAFFGHVGHVVSNAVRSVLLGMTNGRLARSPMGGPVGHLFKHFTRMSSAFALMSDVAMGTLGAKLKRREKITGRLADALAWMYLASASLKRFVDEGQQSRDLPFVEFSCEHALHEIQTALLGVMDNLPNRPAAWLLRPLIFPLGPRYRPPSDVLGSAVARGLLEDRDARLNLTAGIYVPKPDEPGLGHLEAALDHAVAALAVETKIRDAIRLGQLDKAPGNEQLERAIEAGIVTPEERQLILDANDARNEAIRVDAFDPKTFRAHQE